MNNTVWTKYIELEKQSKVIEEEKKALKALMQLELENLDSKKLVTGDATFSISTRKVWSYSPAVDEITKALKDTKKSEEQTGAASFEEKSFLRVQLVK